MTWKKLLEEQRVAPEPARREELARLRAVAERNLADARIDAADPKRFARHSAYLNTCRQKRNDLSYELAGVVTDSEVKELLHEVPAFQALVDEWLREHHPELS